MAAAAERLARARALCPEYAGAALIDLGADDCRPWRYTLVDGQSLPPMEAVLRQATEQARHDWNEQNAKQGDMSIEEIMQCEEAETFAIAPLPDGRPLTTTLVNTVNQTKLRGATIYTPWCRVDERLEGIAPALIHQRLLGVLTPLKQARRFRQSYRTPFRCNHDIYPSQLKIQETASMSGPMGRFAILVTVNLLRIACGLSHLKIDQRYCDNCVYVTYMPFRISVPRFIDQNRECDTKATKFGGTVVENKPLLKKRKVLLFPNGVTISVGTKEPQAMRETMAWFVPRIWNASTHKRTFVESLS